MQLFSTEITRVNIRRSGTKFLVLILKIHCHFSSWLGNATRRATGPQAHVLSNYVFFISVLQRTIYTIAWGDRTSETTQIIDPLYTFFFFSLYF